MKVNYAIYPAVYKTKAAIAVGCASPEEIFNKYFKTILTADEFYLKPVTPDGYKRTKQNGPTIIFCSFKDKKDTERIGSKIDKYSGIALDIDNKIAGVDDDMEPPHITKEELYEKYTDLEYIFYTTFSHKQTVPTKEGEQTPRDKFRIVFFYDREATLEEHGLIYDYLKSRLSYPDYSDDQMKTQALSLSLPRCRKSTFHEAFSLYHAGERIKVDEVCEKIKRDKPQQIEIADNKLQQGLEPISPSTYYISENEAVNIKNEQSVKAEQKDDKWFRNYLKTKSNALNILSALDCKSIPYAEWYQLLYTCKAIGVSWDDFDQWCMSDPGRYDNKKNHQLWIKAAYPGNLGSLINIAAKLGVTAKYNELSGSFIVGGNKWMQMLEESEGKFDPYKYCINSEFIDKAPDIIHMIMNHIESISFSSCREINFAAALTAVCALKHRRFITSDRRTPNILVLGIAQSGAGKEAAAKGLDAIISHDKSGAVVTSSVATSVAGFIQDMIDSEGNWLYIAQEAKGMLFDKFDPTIKGSHLRGLDDEFTAMYDKADGRHHGHGKTKRKNDEENEFLLESRRTKASNNVIINPHFSFFGTSTYEIMDIFHAPHGINGMMGRFVTIFGPKLANVGEWCRSFPSHLELPPELKREVNKITRYPITDGVNSHPIIVEYESDEVSKHIHSRWQALAGELNDMYSQDKDLGAALLTRVTNNAKKIALGVTEPGKAMTMETLNWAFDFVLGAARTCIQAAQDRKDGAAKSRRSPKNLALRVLRVIRDAGVISLRDICRNLKESSSIVESLLEVLIAEGVVYEVNVKNSNGLRCIKYTTKD